MGLISTEVEVGLGGKNIKYYENLGYEIPRITNQKVSSIKQGTIIKVKVEDLPKHSSVLVDVKCDNCGKELTNIIWDNYTKRVHENNKYYCKKCGILLIGLKNSNKTKLAKSISFEQWCTENNRQDVLDRWDYDLNKDNPNEVSFKSNKKYYFKCPKGIHNSELKNINNFVNGIEGTLDCKVCNSFAFYLINTYGEDALELYWDYEKNIDKKGNPINPWELSKSTNSIKIWIKCKNKEYHNSNKTTSDDVFRYGINCPYCTNSRGKVHRLDSLGTLFPEVLDIWSDKNGNKSPYEYSPKSNKYLWWKCLDGKHEDYYRKVGTSNDCDFRCPECSKEKTDSFIQEKVRLYLESLNYNMLHERNCTIIPINPKTKYLLPFDNEIIINGEHLIIETHGIQHYEKTGFNQMSAKRYNTTPEYELHYQKLKDRYKRIFAKSQGYFYLEIPYWTDDKEETWKKLIDEKIKEIKNNFPIVKEAINNK